MNQWLVALAFIENTLAKAQRGHTQFEHVASSLPRVPGEVTWQTHAPPPSSINQTDSAAWTRAQNQLRRTILQLQAICQIFSCTEPGTT